MPLAHNAYGTDPVTDHPIIHGAGGKPEDEHVARADHAAPFPEHEHGMALNDMPGGLEPSRLVQIVCAIDEALREKRILAGAVGHSVTNIRS
ncbi:hypothetical protein F5Y19DRAFT_481698 [Xylariaceae sp. FL1651]|nr:hypothetical protein F5Y19DRAFT_481698 [Xylariaceae sp. FL1651]